MNRRSRVLLTLFVLALPSLAVADTFSLPVLPASEYYKHGFFHFGQTPPQGDTSMSFSNGFLTPWAGPQGGPIIGSGFANANWCCNNVPNSDGRLSFSFGGRVVKDLKFHLTFSPYPVRVCGNGCQIIQSDQMGDIVIPGPTKGITIQFITQVTWWQAWSISVGNQFEFTPVSTAENPVIFVPGMAASVLSNGNNVAWPGVIGLSDLSLDPNVPHPSLQATDAVRSYLGSDVYGQFLQFMAANRYKEYRLDGDPSRLTATCSTQQLPDNPKLFVFPYDWRRSNAESAEKLADYVQCVQRYHPGKKIDIVAHSNGGLVARRMLITNPAAAAATRQVITMGTPNLGATKAVGTIYHGTFLGGLPGILLSRTFQRLTEHYPGMHELMPSRPLFPPAVDPLVEPTPMEVRNWDGGTSLTMLHLDYDMFADRLDLDFPATLPGSTGKAFHDRPGQDDWSNSTVTVPFTQFVGIGNRAETIVKITRLQRIWTTPAGARAEVLEDHFVYGLGDGTVPVTSAARRPALLASNTTIKQMTGDNDIVSHTRLPANGQIQYAIVDLLNPSTTPAAPSSFSVAGNADPATTESILGTEEAVYASLSGVGPLTLTDDRGRRYDLSSEAFQNIPGVVVDGAGERSFSIVTNILRGLRAEFDADGKPFGVELAVGLSNIKPRLAYRFNDVDIAPGSKVRVVLPSFWSTGEIKYDADRDGFFEGTVAPTAALSGESAEDVTAPEMTISGTSTITIDAVDASAGVSQIRYSTDGTHFIPYSGPFAIDTSSISVVYAFADDRAGNRTPLAKYRVPQSSRTTVLTYRGPASGEYGAPLSLAASLTTSDGAAVAGRTITFTIAGAISEATTDSNGLASVTITPASVGEQQVVASFAGTATERPSQASATVTIERMATTLEVIVPSPLTYAHGAVLSATLLASRSHAAIAGAPVSFSFGSETLTGVTAGDGSVSVEAIVRISPGPATVAVHYDGDAHRAAADAMASVVVQKQPSAIATKSSILLAAGYAQHVSARLFDPVTQSPIAGKQVGFSAGGVTATAITNELGDAMATLTLPSQSVGVASLITTFAGDDTVLPSTTTAEALLYQPTRFVVWAGNTVPLALGQTVTYWSPDWAKQVSGGDYHAANDFKGNAETATLPAQICEAERRTTSQPVLTSSCWTSKGGETKPADTNSLIGVIVATSIDKKNGTIYGNVAATIVIETMPPAANGTRTGRIRAIIEDGAAVFAHP